VIDIGNRVRRIKGAGLGNRPSGVPLRTRADTRSTQQALRREQRAQQCRVGSRNRRSHCQKQNSNDSSHRPNAELSGRRRAQHDGHPTAPPLGAPLERRVRLAASMQIGASSRNACRPAYAGTIWFATPLAFAAGTCLGYPLHTRTTALKQGTARGNLARTTCWIEHCPQQP